MKKIIFLFATLIAFGSANAQSPTSTATQTVNLTIPAVALIAVSTSPVALEYNASTIAAGQNLQDAVVAGSYLQYTSIMTGTTTKSIYASSVSTGAALTAGGISLTVEAISFPTASPATVGAGQSNGFFGATTGQQFIVDPTQSVVKSASYSSTSPKVITNIASCYTGYLPSSGPQIQYRATMSTTGATTITPAMYQQIKSGAYSFTVTFTLADTV